MEDRKRHRHIHQWFSTTVPWHATVPWRSVRCAMGNHPISHKIIVKIIEIIVCIFLVVFVFTLFALCDYVHLLSFLPWFTRVFDQFRKISTSGKVFS